MKKRKILWYDFKAWLDRNFMYVILILAILALIWALIRPNPGTSKIW